MSLTVYKYTERRWAEKLVNEGSVKLGSLYEYRNSYEGSSLQDEKEGTGSFEATNIIHLIDQNRNSATDSYFSDMIQPFGVNNLQNVGIYVEDGGKTINNKYLEYSHIFSASLEASQEIMKNFQKDEETKDYDACVEIANFENFLDEINHRLLIEYYHSYDIKEVDYSGNTQGHTEYTPYPLYFKDKKFSWQKEIRGLWFKPISSKETQGRIIEPIPEIRHFCRIIDL